jgi:hypothetical protein
MRAWQQPARRGQEHAVNGGGRRSARGTPKNREFVPEDDDLEFFEVLRPRVQSYEFQ